MTTPLAAVVPLVLIGALQDSLSGCRDPFSTVQLQTAEAAVLSSGPPTGGACGILGLEALRITNTATTVDQCRPDVLTLTQEQEGNNGSILQH